MEYCENGTLAQLIFEKRKKGESLSEEVILTYLTQISIGIKYLHGRNIVHGDLKLENVFLDSKLEIKIGDFGVCKFVFSNAKILFFNEFKHQSIQS